MSGKRMNNKIPRKKVVKKKISKKKPKKSLSKSGMDNGRGLQYKETFSFDITAVNNGYQLNTGYDNYIFTDIDEMMDFIREDVPMKGTESNFIDKLSDEEGPDVWCTYEDDEEEDDGAVF